MNNQLLKPKEVAERLNVSRSQAYVLIRDGDTPPTSRALCSGAPRGSGRIH
jgi:predicted DNA-binding transcriptional regulator AlpA